MLSVLPVRLTFRVRAKVILEPERLCGNLIP